MKRKVKITGLPKAKGGGSMKTYGPQTPPHDATASPTTGSYHGGNDPEIKVNRTLKPTTKENATLEAEKGETVITNLQGEGIPEFYKIAGKPHSRGGTFLNLPANSFIFSKDKALYIKDEEIQKMFGKPFKKKGYSPADLSMTYDLNKYREILVDPSTDKKQKETAEKMIKNYNLKLGSLALVQESMKGFQDGIPAVAQPYMDHMGISPADLLGTTNMPKELPQMRYGGQAVPKFNLAGNFNPADPNQIMTPEEAAQNQWKHFDIKSKMGWEANPAGQKKTWDTLLAGAQFLGTRDEAAAAKGWATETAGLENIAQSYVGDTGNEQFNAGQAQPDNLTEVQFTGTESGLARMGGTQGKRKVKITSMPKYRHGGPHYGFPNSKYTYDPQPDGSTYVLDRKGRVVNVLPPQQQKQTTTSKSKYKLPDNAQIHDPNKPGYDASKIKPGHFVVQEDGSLKKFTGKKLMDYDQKYRDENLGLSEKFQDAYGLMHDKIENNPRLKQGIIDQYKKDLTNLKPGKNLTKEDIVYMQNMKDEDIIKNFYDYQLRNYKVADHVKDLTGKDKEAWDRAAGKGQVSEVLKELGYNDDQIGNTGATAAFQNTYAAIAKLSQSGEYEDELKGLKVGQVGMADEAGAGTGLETISDVDGWYGNTTAGEILLPVETEDVFEDVEKVQEELVETEPLKPSWPRPPAKAWLQDQINVGKSLWDYASAVKEDPWTAMPLYTEEMPTFTSFDKPADDLTSQIATSVQGAGMYAGPQAMNARTADFNRKAARALGDLSMQEDKFNTGEENRFKQIRMNARNRFNELKAGLATSQYDKQIAANQAFRNEKRALGWNMINQINNLITNKWKTDTMNQMYPQYAVNPAVGGQLYFDPSQTTELTASNAGPTASDRYAEYQSKYPGMDDKHILKLIELDQGKSPIPDKDPRSVVPGYPGMVGPNSYPGGLPT